MTRSYSGLLKRLKTSLGANRSSMIDIGEISTNNKSYRIVKIVLGEGNRKRVLLAAGIHGDEPAGVDALCAFLREKKYLRYIDDCELTILPCINPTGYEAGTRMNHKNIDLNRKFKIKKPPLEVRFVQSVYQKPFIMTLELHEDNESGGFYLYQARDAKGKTILGYKILRNVENIMRINASSEIDGMTAEQGIIKVKPKPKKMKWWPMAIYSMVKGAAHFLTLETPSTFPLKKRVRAHLLAIETALDNTITR